MQFADRVLKCADCGNDFVFTAGEQLFFADKQFKNDPKRCKLCKAKRAGLGRSTAAGSATLPLSRTETRTNCSSCGIETTVPFKPTQGRPVLCRSCFQLKRVPAAVAAVATMDVPGAMEAQANAALDQALAEQGVELTLEAPIAIPTELIAETQATGTEAEAVALSAPSSTTDA